MIISKGADHLTLKNVQLSALTSGNFAFTGTLPSDTTPPAQPTFTPATGFLTSILETTSIGSIVGSINAEAGATLRLVAASPFTLICTNLVLASALDFEAQQASNVSVFPQPTSTGV